MNTRLQQFLAAENISQSNFADTIGVARASISHIISGRNKPGFDFMVSVAKFYPTLNIDWLITGRGKMYKNSGSEPQNSPSDALFEPQMEFQEDDEPVDLFDSEPTPLVKADLEPFEASKQPRQRQSTERVRIVAEKASNRGSNRIRKIIVFFDDNTYQELN